MTLRRLNPFGRLCALALLLLAILPVSAPFATCDLRDLLGEAPADARLLQSKTIADTHAPALNAGQLVSHLLARGLVGRVSPIPSATGTHVPLRI
jgi:hypothetical protein